MFSEDAEDEVYTTLVYPDGSSGQLSVNWSDESCRKMTTRITLWGTGGRIFADRQEVQAYLRQEIPGLSEYGKGWTVRNTTELTDPVWFYLRGEEYSAQLDYFFSRVTRHDTDGLNSFTSAAATDRTLEMIGQGAIAERQDLVSAGASVPRAGDGPISRWRRRRP